MQVVWCVPWKAEAAVAEVAGYCWKRECVASFHRAAGGLLLHKLV